MSIEITLTTAEAWIIRNTLVSESARLYLKELELKDDKYNKQQLETIASNRSLLKLVQLIDAREENN